MNYGELKTAILDYSHRPDLSGQVAGFVRLAEGMIRRDLTAMPTSTTLNTPVAAGVYALPVDADSVRAVYAVNASGDSYALEQVGLYQLRRLAVTATPLQYAVIGDNIEIRGLPDPSADIEVHYMGHPVALDDDADTNELLADHEALYVYGSLFYLYQFTQDPELAQGALDTFSEPLRKLNEHAGRRLGGASVAPAYHFGPLHQGY